jgi:hypothetical protein
MDFYNNPLSYVTLEERFLRLKSLLFYLEILGEGGLCSPSSKTCH